MKKNNILLICTVSLIVMSSSFISCGKENIKKNNEENIVITEDDKRDEELHTEEGIEVVRNSQGGINAETEDQFHEVEVINFDKYSDKFLVDFVNNGTDSLMKDLNTTTIVPYVYNVRKASYTELVEPIETIEKRQEIINKYYGPGVYNEEYVTENGVTYFKTDFYKDHVRYKFKSVKSREIIDNNRLRVTFNVSFYYSEPKINKKYKTVEFSEIDGQLRAVTLFEDQSMFNILENGDSDYNIDPALDIQQKELFDYVDEALQGVMNPEFIVNGINYRCYDSSTNSKYYAISVLEPNACSVPYFVNIKNGAIYGVYEGRFVVEPKV